MAATVIIEEHNGAVPGTPTDKTSGTIRFKNADNATVDLNNPLVVPATGQEYSFEKWLRLKINGGAFTEISNPQAYTDGDLFQGQASPSEVNVFYASAGTYQAPSIPDQSVTPPQNASAGSPVENMTNLALRVAASRIDMDAINAGPFTDGSPSEEIGDFLVLVMQVFPGATNGVLTSETLTFSYDEI